VTRDGEEPIERATVVVARWLSARHSRRSFIGILGRLALGVAGASVVEAIELTAPSMSAFASHCNPGYHAGSACTYQTTCAANGWTDGQYWLSCCSGICGNCFDGRRYVKFRDCCGSTGCSGKTSAVYCPSPKCFKCKIQSCTTTICKQPWCFAPEAS
jgi:hypothetical protein